MNLSKRILSMVLGIIILFSAAGCNLLDLVGGETPEVSKDYLIEFYDEVYSIKEADYTEESWSAFASAIRAAERAIASESATQTQIDSALERLEKAFNELEKPIIPIEPEPEPPKVIEGLLDPTKYTLTFSDEFDGDGLDYDKWDVQTGNGSAYGIWGWGNTEAQSYRAQNIEVSGNTLKITAKKERHDGMDYTSARIRTLGKFSQTYGRFEARIKAPLGQGFWPAFWMLADGDNWPLTGELDIMEARGREPYKFSGAMHFKHSNGFHTYLETGSKTVSAGINTFNVYGLEWRPGKIEWLLNGEVVHTITEWDSFEGGITPFNAPFHLILNLAVGGHFDGFKLPNESDLPGVMEVDYVRAYQFKQ